MESRNRDYIYRALIESRRHLRMIRHHSNECRFDKLTANNFDMIPNHGMSILCEAHKMLKWIRSLLDNLPVDEAKGLRAFLQSAEANTTKHAIKRLRNIVEHKSDYESGKGHWGFSGDTTNSTISYRRSTGSFGKFSEHTMHFAVHGAVKKQLRDLHEWHSKSPILRPRTLKIEDDVASFGVEISEVVQFCETIGELLNEIYPEFSKTPHRL